MITPEILASIMFITTLLLLLFGFPVAFTLAGSALFFAFLGDVLEIFNFKIYPRPNKQPTPQQDKKVCLQ